ncbi:glycosyltransferase family 4 protein [Agrobacterium vitis]|uniref:glycosyltransferase family 4 protein n=1 Tax=Agrobacterium vitis TaxID=373 RepID=UPI000871FB46|nr:glycosyltransferase family 4 protein [Agrobacterium vitis]MCM2469095.1 glycosyltransferase family 4 protein [Agrobacterium vitis]
MYKEYVRQYRRRARLARPDRSEEDAYLAALVEPNFYAKVTGLKFLTDRDATRHFIDNGISEGLLPSAFFGNPTNLKGDDYRRYLLAARTNGPPSGWFDVAYYRLKNPDVARAIVEPFEHFVRWGIFENRNPNSVFDASWYEASYERRPQEIGMFSFKRFAAFGDERKQAPSRWLLPIFDHSTPTSGTTLERLGRLLPLIKRWESKLGAEPFQFLAGLFYSYTYDGGGVIGPEADGVERFVHFLTEGMERGLDPGPLYDSGFYKEGEGYSIANGERLIHLLQKGEKHKGPSRLYDDAAYRAANSDLDEPNFWTYRHFVMHGLYEGRPTGTVPRAYVALLSGDLAEHQLGNWKRFWTRSQPEKLSSSIPQSVVQGEARLKDFLTSDIFQESVARACALEPSLGSVPDYALVLPPVYDAREAARVELMKRFPRLTYDAIVCAPFLRTGGADLVACLLSEALANDPDRRVLLLRTDLGDFERPDWVPESVDTVDISDVIRKLPRPQAEEYFYSLLLGLGPKQVFNVNSNLCWRTFARYGARLSRLLKLYSYLFCWDRDTRGNLVGYPSDFYTATAANLNGIFTDTEYLRNELIKLHRPPAAIADRLLPLFSPIRQLPSNAVSNAVEAAKKERARPRILWGGRLDRQKRFDLAFNIAHAMPDVDFICWGAGSMDTLGPLGEFPSNLELRSPFKSYDELPLDDADAWLFTSAWEGMPTLIIELAVRGVPIVASAVGGIPELIDETTGYPIAADAEYDVYVAALRKVIADPADRVERAGRLQTKALERHSRGAYIARLEQILREET